MTRQTRAAARAQEAEAEINIATDDTATDGPGDVSQDCTKEDRPALVELTSNTLQEIEVAIEATNEKSDSKNGKGTKRGRPTKKGTAKGTKKGRQAKVTAEGSRENQEHSPDSSKASTAGEDKTLSVATPVPTQVSPTTIENENNESEPEQESLSMDNMKEPVIHETSQETLQAGAVQRDSMTESSEDPEVTTGNQFTPARGETGETSIQSPARTLAAQHLQSLFEEPVEKPEDAMSLLAEATSMTRPVSAEKQPSPHPAKASPQKDTRNVIQSPAAKKSKPALGSTRLSTTHRRATSEAASKTSRTKASPPRSSAAVAPSRAKPSDKPSAAVPGLALAERTNEHDNKQGRPRSSIAALHTPPRVSKSTKPLTKSNFTLPSEALRDKLKAQKEERQKRQEEIAARLAGKKQAPGASIKPVRRPSAAAKPTVAARSTPKPNVPSPANTVEKPKSKPAVAEAQKRARTLVHRTRPSMAQQSPKVESNKSHVRKSSAPVVRENKAATLRRTGSVSKPGGAVPRATEKKPEVKAAPKIDAKREEKPFDKAAAARKARAEAAEKGRAASREWAEKKRKETEAKKFAAKAAVATGEAGEGDSELKENVPPGDNGITA